MSKINQIQQAILSLGAGAYQKLMDAYLFKRYRYENIMPLGSHIGTDKTTKGIPDSFVMCENKKFILISYGKVRYHENKQAAYEDPVRGYNNSSKQCLCTCKHEKHQAQTGA